MARVYPGTAEGRALNQAQFAALSGAFRPNRAFRLAVSGAAITSGGLALELAGGDVIWLPNPGLGQVQWAGEAAICAAILVNDGATPPNATALAGATIEIGYVRQDSWLDNVQTKA